MVYVMTIQTMKDGRNNQISVGPCKINSTGRQAASGKRQATSANIVLFLEVQPHLAPWVALVTEIVIRL